MKTLAKFATLWLCVPALAQAPDYYRLPQVSEGDTLVGSVRQADGRRLVVLGPTRPIAGKQSDYRAAVLKADLTIDDTVAMVGFPAIADSVQTVSGTLPLPDGMMVYGTSRHPKTETSDAYLVKVLANGKIDTNFGDNGAALASSDFGANDTTGAAAVAPDATLRLALLGTANGKVSLSVVALGSLGEPLASFGNNGVVKVPQALEIDRMVGVLVTRDGSTIVAYLPKAAGEILLAKFDAKGAVVTGFGDNGVVRTGFKRTTNIDLRELDGGRLLLANGRTNTVDLAVFLADGKWDTGFEANGKPVPLPGISDFNNDHIAIAVHGNRFFVVGNLNGGGSVTYLSRVGYFDVGLDGKYTAESSIKDAEELLCGYPLEAELQPDKVRVIYRKFCQLPSAYLGHAIDFAL